MSSNRSRVLVAVAGVALTLIVAAELPRMIRPARAGDPPPQAPGKYMGASACDGPTCHAKAEPRNPPPALQEYTAWSSPNDQNNPPVNDRHSYAYKRLKPKAKGGDDKSGEIMTKLNGMEGTKDTAETSERCLTCHGVAVHDYGIGKKNPGAAVGLHKELQAAKYNANDGVSCDGCHGPAEKYLKKHDKAEWTIKEWKKDGGKNGGSQKLYDENGIYYSKDLELWARQCVRCHLRIDTNMVEAGHPDLNPFELFAQSFNTAHWRDYTSATAAPELPGAGPTHACNSWQAGQAVALENALQSVATRARGDKFNKADAGRMKESFERARGHFVVARHGLDKVAADAVKAIATDMEALEKLVKAEKPDLAAIAAAAEKLAAQMGPVVRKAADSNADVAQVTAILNEIAEDPASVNSSRAAEQAGRAFYAVGYAYFSATKPDVLTDQNMANPFWKAINALYVEVTAAPDVKGDSFKKAFAAVKAACPKK